MALYELHPTRQLERPVLVTSLEGWVDAGLGAANAILNILGSVETEPLATFDTDALIDYRARRPVARIVEGVNTGLKWQQLQLRAGRDAAGNDMAFLVGPEPDFRWHEFLANVAGLSEQIGVRLAVGLGAFPAPAPHTRPVRLAATATSAELASRVGFVNGTLEVPAGIESALERELDAAGIPAIGLWARVPHYVSAMAFPAASAALVEGLCAVAGLSLDSSALRSAGDETLRKVDKLIADSQEHTAMVRQLESTIDAAEGNPLNLGEVPTGDEIAAELERYLRGER
jgi:hypothetical protein